MASVFQEEIKGCQREVLEIMGDEEEEGEEIGVEDGKVIYQWQKIQNVKNYVDKLVQNPAEAKNMKR